MRVLVTGGAGFIGSAVCRALVAELGWSVLNLDKLTYAGNLSSLAEIEALANYSFVKGDIGDRGLLDHLLGAFQPDAVLNLAAETHVDRSITSSAAFIETNIVGAHALLEASLAYWRRLGDRAAKERFRFLHVSTDEVFGSLGEQGRFTEASPYDPRSPYAASKAGADHLVRAWFHTYGLPVLITNCSNNYGPRQYPEKLMPLMILNGLEGRELPVYGEGANVRDWLHVEDHARALICVLQGGRAGETYAIGGACERRNLEVVNAICDVLDELAPSAAIGPRRNLIRFVEDRPGHDQRYAIDSGKMETQLAWRPLVGFEEGVRRTVEWYLNNADWWRPLRERYRGERLGLQK